MPVSIVVGGQYGSEAKAKAAVAVGLESVAEGGQVCAVRCGGPNAGHTVWVGDKSVVLRLVPSGVVIPNTTLYIAAGALVDIELLKKEIDTLEGLGVPVSNRLYVDGQAAIVTPELIEREKTLALGTMIGSTQTGTGSTTAARALRDVETMNAVRHGGLPFSIIDSVGDALHSAMAEGLHVIVEGTQGFALSMFHSGYYPWTTSKDTTASAFAAEAGIAPNDVDEVVMVIRTYPIRVGGNSGPLPNEITWQDVQERCGAPEPLIEMTSVTKKVRRVAEFDWELLDRACKFNQPSSIAIHGADYLDWKDRGVRDINKLSDRTIRFAVEVQVRTGAYVTSIFTGPHQDDMVRVRESDL